ncbi:DUF2157 domain-containing protein [Flagellimonas crocea]|uniref:DUF2157 domain-containing protein n=1 Tax=Flagellimonas crocea TaxID=3067311 RepID=UPI00296FF0E0|nr:DUF2157 domain-containing protein [Muricauda sp. DH64]
MSLLKDLPELINAGVISKDTAADIETYYKSKNGPPTNRLFLAFGILGALLVGLGCILIIAHNWDDFSRSTKTIFAFLPLLLGQALCGYALWKKADNLVWKESATVFLFCAVGASIALVSQIYNIPGNLSGYLITWMLLCLPLIYVMKSSMASLLYIIGTTYYACETSYWGFPTSESYPYWAMLVAIVSHYHGLLTKKPKSNFTRFHNWIVPLSIIIVLGTLSKQSEELMFVAYMSLFGLFYIFGTGNFFELASKKNGYTLLGSLGTIISLLILSFNEFWNHLIKEDFLFDEVFIAPEFIVSLVVTLLAAVLLYFNRKKISVFSVAFLVFVPIFFLGTFSSTAVLLINLLVLVIGVLTIRDGADQNHLGILNYGLLIITALIISRFFDTDLSFVVRGVLFVSVGVGFFLGNYWMLKKRSGNEK